MKITFLGTGTSQGVPVIACKCAVCTSSNPKDNRLRSSILVQQDQTNIVIDSGPDFRQQMLRAGVTHIDGLVFTHEHKDHVAGMDDIRAFNYVNKRKVDVYATELVHTALKREFPYVFEDMKYPGVPEIDLHLIGKEKFKVGEVELQPVEVLHYRLPVNGYRIGNFTYITDANFIPEETYRLIEGSEVLVINALRKEPHISHFTLNEALEVIQKVKPRQAFLTHISHQLGLNDEVNATLPSNVSCAYDGLEITLD